MRWPAWLHWPEPPDDQAVRAQREQEAKLRQFRREVVPETRQTVHSFTVAVEVAMRRRR